MKRCLTLCLLSLILTAGLAHAELNVYLDELSIAARNDFGNFTAELGARFGLSRGEVEVVLSNVDRPADAAMVLWLGEHSHQSRERVLEVYREEKRGGWGAMAKSLGIKPGSDDFHALKAGRLDFHPKHSADKSKGKDKEKGKDKDHGKSDKHK